MPKAIPMERRIKIAAFVQAGHSYNAAAARFGVSDTFVAKLIKYWRETGSLEPGRQDGKRGGRLAPLHGFLIQTLEDWPDISMPRLAALVYEKHGVRTSSSDLSRCLIDLGFRFQAGFRFRGVRGRFRKAA